MLLMCLLLTRCNVWVLEQIGHLKIVSKYEYMYRKLLPFLMSPYIELRPHISKPLTILPTFLQKNIFFYKGKAKYFIETQYSIQ